MAASSVNVGRSPAMSKQAQLRFRGMPGCRAGAAQSATGVFESPRHARSSHLCELRKRLFAPANPVPPPRGKGDSGLAGFKRSMCQRVPAWRPLFGQNFSRVQVHTGQRAGGKTVRVT